VSPFGSIRTVKDAGVWLLLGATNSHGMVPLFMALAAKAIGEIPSVLVSVI
jgi:hypothetical protein